MYPSNSPSKRKERRDRFNARHPGVLTAYSRNWNLRRKYGISTDDWNALFKAQGKCCAICGSKHPGGRYWHTDHSGPLPCTRHQVRGILCLHCNHAIGKGTTVELDRERARVAYLERWL